MGAANVADYGRTKLNGKMQSTSSCRMQRGSEGTVETVKHDGEVSIEYMKIFEREEMLRKQGYKEGESDGERRGEIRGETKKLIQLVSKKVQKGQNSKIIAETLEEDETYIQSIIEVMERYAPEYDENKIYEDDFFRVER